MELKDSKKQDLNDQEKDQPEPLAHRIHSDQIRLLYQQNPFGIAAQSFAAVFLTIALWKVVPRSSLISWLFYMLLLSTLWLITAIYYHLKETRLSQDTWLILFAVFTFLSGCGWGIAGSLLMPAESLVHQTFVVILIFGMTAGSISFFSPVTSIYSLFLLPTFIPFNIWLFLQGGIYIILGFSGLIYMPIIFASCYYSNKFLLTSLSLAYKNVNLDLLNQLLEKRVAQRTSELEKSLALTQSTLESTAEGLLVVDRHGNIEYYNQQFIDMWQMPAKFTQEPDWQFFINEIFKKLKHPQIFLTNIDELQANPKQERFDEIISINNNVFEWHAKPHKMHDKIVGRVWSFRDITMRKQMEQQLAYQANHDLLTGLPNRTLLYDRINQGIAHARRDQTRLIIMFLDIDNFKLINDNLGHNAGDMLLQEIAQRLLLCTRESDTVARFGGDEFVILLVANTHKEIRLVSQRILTRVAQSIELASHEIVVTASIGISIYPHDGNDAATLLKNADMAMYMAKNQGRNTVKLYHESIKNHSKKSLEMQIELRNALLRNEFYLLYQPTIDLKTGQISGVEALVRWRHPKRGIIFPQHFIPIAEESRIIIPLGEWILQNACLQNKDWQSQGLRPVRMAINVSGVQIMRENFADIVEQSLASAQLSPQYIEIELTESTIMNETVQNLYTLKRLKEIGINLTIDDFGTGYSSLNYLKQFPVNKLKIDQSFVSDCISEQNDASIVEAIIAMGHSLKLKVLAEGIETEEQLQFLQQCQCDEGQGFFYGQPMSAEAFAKLLSEDLDYSSE
ncbi:EAL domain-containing protein [Legionella feeleii]|uniref:cyclic-guanylate-specific phosphodiesterase n=1 Tax=Legionella feeleii TaxID=453 RepID=A0A378IXC6_9GAMM|nr:EAL domain-containing protein [Legionella feeleii]STX39673.1 inner membrane protein [Legionella feeleii]